MRKTLRSVGMTTPLPCGGAGGFHSVILTTVGRKNLVYTIKRSLVASLCRDDNSPPLRRGRGRVFFSLVEGTGEGLLLPVGMTKKESLRIGIQKLSLKKGGYLLSHFVGSTIGVGGLNFSVRNGKRWNTAAIAT